MAEQDEEEGLGYLNTLVSIVSRASRGPHLLRYLGPVLFLCCVDSLFSSSHTNAERQYLL